MPKTIRHEINKITLEYENSFIYRCKVNPFHKTFWITENPHEVLYSISYTLIYFIIYYKLIYNWIYSV